MQDGSDSSQILTVFSKISEGFAYCKIIVDKEGKPVDWIYLDINDAYVRINGGSRESVVGKCASEVLPNLRSDPADWINLYGQVALTGQPVSTERFAAVRNKWYHVSAYSPQIGYFISIFDDISERKKTEIELKKSEDRYRGLFNNMIDGFAYCKMIYDNKGKPVDFIYLEVNEAFENLTGLKKEIVLGKKVSEAIPGTIEANPEVIEIYGKVATDCEQERFEVFFKPLSKWFSIAVYCPQRGYFIAIFENITERKKNEQAILRAKEELEERVRKRTEEVSRERQRLYRVLETLPVYVILLDKDYYVPFANKLFRERFGESCGKQCFDFLFQRGTPCENCETYKVLKTHRRHHWEWTGPDKRDYDIYDFPFVEADGSTLILEMGIDITERKLAEVQLREYRDNLEQLVAERTSQLRESEERWVTTLSSIGDAVIATDTHGKVTFMNAVAETLTGWSYQEAQNKPITEVFNIINEQTRLKIESPVAKVLNEGLVISLANHSVLIRKDGTEVPIDDSGAPIVNGEVITGVVLVFRDITERKKSEKEIARLASYPTLNPNPVFEVDFNGNITYSNPATQILFPDLESLKLSHPFLSDWASIVKVFQTKATKTLGREMKVKGHWYHQQLYFFPQNQQIRIYTVDIDELKQAEEARATAQVKLEENAVLLEEYASQMEELAEQRAQQLKDSERLAGIGQTAGMVGHDIRNPLQAITSDMYLISEEVKSMHDSESKQAILESIDSVNENLVYINKIVSDLQDYTRPLKPSLQDANLSELIEGTILSVNVPKRVEVTTQVQETAKPIKTDIAYLRRILTNLITNGIQAMPDEGKLTIEAAKKASTIMITVQDTGVGIPEEAKARLFTPLFTTKSKGQGLGLAVVKRLVDAMGGTIKFESQENKGTKFTLELPQTK